MSSTAVVQLITDWGKGRGYRDLTRKDIKRARIFDDSYTQDTDINRHTLAMEFGRNNLPVAVLDYETFRSGDMAVLYTVTRDDFEAYLKAAEERDRQVEEV